MGTNPKRGDNFVNEKREFAAKENESDYQFAFRVLFGSIMHMELVPGTILNEVQLMDWLHVGRTPIREAVLRLRECRLVEVQPKKASYVSKINLKCVEEGALVREGIETNILRDVMQNFPTQYIGELSENLEKQEIAAAEGRKHDFWELDNEFHKLLYLAADKPWSWEIVTQATTHLDRVRYLLLQAGMTSDAHSYQGHQDIFKRLLRRRMPEMDDYLYNQITSCYLEKLPDLMKLYQDYFE